MEDQIVTAVNSIKKKKEKAKEKEEQEAVVEETTMKTWKDPVV